jgi:hypothetical protein
MGIIGAALEKKATTKGRSNVHGGPTKMLVTEIEMLKVVFCI